MFGVCSHATCADTPAHGHIQGPLYIMPLLPEVHRGRHQIGSAPEGCQLTSVMFSASSDSGCADHYLLCPLLTMLARPQSQTVASRQQTFPFQLPYVAQMKTAGAQRRLLRGLVHQEWFDLMNCAYKNGGKNAVFFQKSDRTLYIYFLQGSCTLRSLLFLTWPQLVKKL